MSRIALGLFAALSSACAIAFTAGLKQAPPPTKFLDERSPSLDAQRAENQQLGSPPTFGMSLVAGGAPMDAGRLPKAPIPIVLLP